MKRKSRILITLTTAAITFVSLLAIAGDKRMSYWQNNHCEGNKCRHNVQQQEKADVAPTIMPTPTK